MVLLCQLVEIEGRPGFQWCPTCGRVRGYPQGQRRASPAPQNYRRVCAAPPEGRTKRPPSWSERAANYLDARARWQAAGEPLRSDAEREALLTICQHCPSGLYDAKPVAPLLAGGTCKDCGCGLAKERNVANKIAWATERCARGHWESPNSPTVESTQKS